MEKRRQPRNKRRLTCELLVEGKPYAAIVRDASPGGLFVQTRAKPAEDSVVELVFPATADHAEIRTEAGVARHRATPPRLQAEVPGGLGLELLDAPPALHALLAACGVMEPDEPSEEWPDAAMRGYRVRLTQHGRPGARVLTVRAGTEASARARAQSQAGRGWRIAEIQEI